MGNYKKCRVFFLPFSRGLPKIFPSGHQDPGINTPPANNLRLTKTPPPNPAHTKKANTSNLPRSLHTRPKIRHASRTTTIENPTARKSRITLRQPVEKTETAQKPNTHPRATPETRHAPSPTPPRSTTIFCFKFLQKFHSLENRFLQFRFLPISSTAGNVNFPNFVSLSPE